MIAEPQMKVKHLLPQVRDKYIIQENFTRKLSRTYRSLESLADLVRYGWKEAL